MSWTDAQTEQLKVLYADGCSASEIAFEIGGVTRNAVIGKIHRLQLNQYPSASAKQPKEPRFRLAKARAERRRKVIRNANGLMVMDITFPTLPVGKHHDGRAIPQAQRKSLLELRERDCRFPFGEPGQPGFFFCGALTVTTYPYCAHHCSIAYTGIPVRRR